MGTACVRAMLASALMEKPQAPRIIGPIVKLGEVASHNT